jgi:hypothetical protein
MVGTTWNRWAVLSIEPHLVPLMNSCPIGCKGQCASGIDSSG